MRAVLEWHALTYYPAESAKPYADHYFKAHGEYPVPPKHCAYTAELLDVYYSTITQRSRDDFGCPDPLSATLLRDYLDICGIVVKPEDCKMILECDKHYRDIVLGQCIKHRQWQDRKNAKK